MKNLSKGNRASTTYSVNGSQFRTRADTGGKKSLMDYGRKDRKHIRKDWICVCDSSNFERNIECRNCRRPKEEGLKEEVEIDLQQRQQDKAKSKEQKSKDQRNQNMREMLELKMEIIHHRPILSKSQEFDLVEEEEELSYNAGAVRSRKMKIIR